MIYSVSPKKSGIYIIYVNVEHKKYFKNKMTLAPTGVQTKTSNESDRSDVAASETEDLTQKTIMEVKLKCKYQISLLLKDQTLNVILEYVMLFLR